MSPEFLLLCWACSETLPAPVAADINEEELLRFAWEHRVVPRLLQRLIVEGHPAISPAFRIRLRFARMEIERRFRHQAQTAREIMALTTPPPIYFKGFTVYALTGERSLLRQSGDIDFLAADPDALFAAMTAAGFSGKYKEDDHRGARHEHSELIRNGVVADVHRYHFVHSSQLVGKSADFPSAWSGQFRVIPVTYSDMAPYTMISAAPDTEGLLVLNPTGAALMLCCHIGMAAVRLPMHPVTTLGELADLRFLTLHSRFDPADFLSLAKRLHAEPIVTLSLTLAQRWLGPLALPWLDAKSDLEITAAPDSWACFGMPLEELMFPTNVKATVERLGGDDITGNGVWFATCPGEREKPLCHPLVRNSESETPAVAVSVQWSSECLQISIQWREALPPEDELQVWYLINHYAARHCVRYREGETLFHEGGGVATASTDADGLTVQVNVLLDRPEEPPLALETEPGQPMTLMVYLMRWSSLSTGWLKADPIVVLPLRVAPA